jgi:hypothetical protein
MLAPPQSLQTLFLRADARAPTAVLAFAPDAIVRADARAPAVLALAPDAVMRADARAPAVLAFLDGYAVACHESLLLRGKTLKVQTVSLGRSIQYFSYMLT